MIWLILFVLLTIGLRWLVKLLAVECYGTGWFLDFEDAGDRRLAWLIGGFFSALILILAAFFLGRLK